MAVSHNFSQSLLKPLHFATKRMTYYFNSIIFCQVLNLGYTTTVLSRRGLICTPKSNNIYITTSKKHVTMITGLQFIMTVQSILCWGIFHHTRAYPESQILPNTVLTTKLLMNKLHSLYKKNTK